MNAFIERLGWVLVHSVWQFALVALCAGLVSRALRRKSASLRYTVLVVALFATLAGPVVTWLNQADEPRAPHELAAKIPSLESEPVPDRLPALAVNDGQTPVPSWLADAEPRGPTAAVAPSALVDESPMTVTPIERAQPAAGWSDQIVATLHPWMPWIVSGWCLGVVFCSLRPMFGWVMLSRLKRIGVSPVSADIEKTFRRLARQLGLHHAGAVLQSTLTQIPLVVGYFKPVILLPIGLLANLPPSQLEAILAHELAHVRRHDFVVNLLQALLETLFFYHPAVWWLSHRVRVEREHCCDDLVLAVLDNRVEYGRALVAVEELRGRTTVLALGMHDGSLLARIRRIVGATPDRAATLWRDRWPIMGLAVASLLIAVSALWFGLETIAGQKSDAAKDEPGVRQPLKAELPDGRSVEFVGIAKNTKPAAEGWAPDGGPIGDAGLWPSTIILHGGNATAWIFDNGPPPEPDANAIDIFVRFRGLRLQPSIWFDTPTQGVNYLHQPVKEPYEVRGSTRLWKKEQAGALGDRPKDQWRVGLTDEPWGRYVKISPTGEVLNPIQTDERYATTYQLVEVLGAKPNDRVPTGTAIVLHEPNVRSGTPIPVPRYALEFRAVDNDGLVHPANYWLSGRVRNTDLMESEYGLSQPLPQGKTLSHYEFRLRPYRHWVTFDNVSLEPGKMTEVKVSVETVDNAPIETASTEGAILSIDANRKLAVISLGSDDRVKPRTILEVHRQKLEGQRAQPPVIKGKLEVTRILSPNTAEARILAENPAGGVAKGDRVVVLLGAATDDAANQRDPIRVNLKLPRQTFLLGESIPVDYEMQNDGDVAVPYSKGAFYPALRINDGFRMTAVKIDENGKALSEQVVTSKIREATEGKGGGFQLQPGEEYSTTLFVTRYLRFMEPGRYRLRVENINRFEPDAKVSYSAGETIITLKQPTPAEARGVFEKMKQAPRAAYDDNAMRYLSDAADFQAMHQPVYLPILKEFALGGDLDALESLERMESKDANDIVVAVLAAALDRDDWRTARTCFQHLKSFLPFPNWYLDTSSEQDKANRDRVARTWGPDFVPALTKLAKRLNMEVAAQMKERGAAPRDADAQDPEFLKVFRYGRFPLEHPQSLLLDVDYIYRCVGRPEDFADCLAAFAQSIELTKSLPLETNQYFRPRGSAFGFHHTVVYMIQRGAQVPPQPKHPGEAAAFALALRNQPGFRPEGWEAVITKWLRGDSPYLAEVILDHLPATVPAEVLAYLPTALADNYVDLQIAACNVAKAHPDPVFREPLQKILDTADDKYLRKYAVDAARANGLNAQYDDDAPFVDKTTVAPKPPQKQKELPNEKGDDTKADNPQDQAALPAAETPVPAQPAFVLPDHLNVMAVGFDSKSNKLVTVATESDVRIRTWNLADKTLVSDVKLASELHGNRFLTGHLTLNGDCSLVIAAIQGQVRIWNTETGAVVRMLKLPEGVGGGLIQSLACTPDLKYVAGGVSAGRQVDSQAVVWNAATGDVIQTVTLVGAVQTHSVALSPDGKMLATGGQKRGTRVWEVKTGNLLLDLPNDFPDRKHPDQVVSLDGASQVLCLRFSPNGKSLAIGDMRGVKLVDIASGELLHDFDNPFRMGRSRLVVSHDGRLLARTATDKSVPIWSTRTGKVLVELPTESNDGAFSPDGKWFAAGFSDAKQALAVWRLTDDDKAQVNPGADTQPRDDAPVGAPIGTSGGVEVGIGQRQDRVVWTADSQQVFATGDFSSLTQWQHNGGRWQATSLKGEYHANSITASTLKGSPLVVLGTNVGTAEVWDSAAGKRARELRASPNYSVYAVAISPDDALVAACGTDGTVAVFDRASGQLKVRLGQKADTRMASLAFAPDGKTLAALDRYGVLVLWSITAGERLAEWKGIGGEECTMQFAPDGRQLGVTGYGKVTLIETNQGAKPRVVGAPEEVVSRYPESLDSRRSGPHPGGIRYASVTALAPDMRMAASIDPLGAAVIWDLASRKIVQRLPIPAPEALVADSAGQGLRNLVYSPDGQRLAATSIRGHVVFWQAGEPATAQKMATPALLLPDHWIVSSVGFDNQDKELVTVSTQNYATIRRWDVAGKKLISEIKLEGDKHGRQFREGTFQLSGDRRRVIAATDAYVGIWDTATGKLVWRLPIPKIAGNDTVRILTCTPDLSVIVGNLETSYDRTTLVYDAYTVVWDGITGKLERFLTHKGHNRFHSMSLSSDGKRLATTNGGGATIWDTTTGKQLLHVPNDNAGRKHSNPETSSLYTNHVWSLQFSPNGQQLAIGDILGVRLVDAASGKLLQQLEGPYSYSSGSGGQNLVFSQNGEMLARLGTGDKIGGKSTGYIAPIWSTQTGQKLFELQTNANDAVFSADGQQLAIGFSDLQQALAVWPLNGKPGNDAQTDGPGPESRQDKVEENGHYNGKTAAEFVETFKPTWGDAKFGLQYGIAMTKPQLQFRAGERVPLVVFFRNASNKPLKLDMRPDFFGNTPRVRSAQGAAVEFENIPLLGSIPHYVEHLEPGAAVGPFYLNFGLGENPRPGKQHWHPFIKTPVAGPCKLTHEVSIDVVGLKDGDQSQRLKVTSGQIEFEIVGGDRAGAQRNADIPGAEVIEAPTLILADLVRKFNQENKQLGQGLDQPALTENEVIEFIKRSDRKREAKDLNDQEFAAFKSVAESKRLPKDSYLQVYTEQPHDVFFVDHLWQVRLMLPAIGHDGFVGLTIRDTKVAEEKIDPKLVAWGPPDKSGLSLGAYLSPKMDKYQLGERVRLRLFVRNDGEQPVKTVWANTSHPMPDDFTVTDEKGMQVAVRKGRDQNWEVPWVSGFMSGGLAPGEVHRLYVPYEISIGGDGSNKLVGRVIDARPGQTLQLRVRESNGNERERAKGEPEPESGKITFSVADEAPAQADINPNGEIRGHLLDEAGKPVPDATLACGAVLSDSGAGGGSNAITDAQGRYRLLLPSSGIYIVWLKKYGNAEMTAAADDGLLVEAGKITESRMTLVQGTPVAGVLVDEQNEPVPAITVYCYSTARPQAGTTVMSVETDDEGRFKFLLPPGRAHLYANSREQVLGAEGKKLVARVHFNLTVPQRDDVPPKQAPLLLKLVPSEVKFGDPIWVANSTPRTRIVAHANARDVTGTVVDERGLPLRGVKVFKEDGPFIVTGDEGEFRYPIDKGTQFVMYAFAPGYNVWFGTPTSGDVLTIGLEKKVPVQVARAVEQKSQGIPKAVADLDQLIRNQAQKLAEGRLELDFENEWDGFVNSKDGPKAIVTRTTGKLSRLKKGDLIRVDFTWQIPKSRQIANPDPKADFWTASWVSGFDGERAYDWNRTDNVVRYGQVRPAAKGLSVEQLFWGPFPGEYQRLHPEARSESQRQVRDGREMWDLFQSDTASKSSLRILGIDPAQGYLPAEVEVHSQDKWRARRLEVFEAAPGVPVPRKITLEFLLPSIADNGRIHAPTPIRNEIFDLTSWGVQQTRYLPDRMRIHVARLEPGEAAGIKAEDFAFTLPNGVTVEQTGDDKSARQILHVKFHVAISERHDTKQLILFNLPPEAWKYVGQLTGIEEIHVSAGDVRGEGMTQISRIPGLKKLNIVNAKCMPADLAALAGHPSLESLDVMLSTLEELDDDARRTELLRSFSQAEKSRLDAALGRITEKQELPQAVLDLNRRGLQCAVLTDRALHQLTGLNHLTSLRLINSWISPHGLSALKKLPDLRDVHVGLVDLTSGTGTLVASFPQLRSFGTAYGHPRLLTELASAPQLEALDIHGLSDDCLDELLKIRRLKSVRIWASQISDAGFLRLADLPQLNQIELGATQGRLTKAGVAALQSKRPTCRVSGDDQLPEGPLAAGPDAPTVNALPKTTAEFDNLMQANTAKLAEGRLELALDYEWQRPTKDNPKRTVATQGTMRRIRKGKLLRIDFERQIANPSPDESNSWPDQWVTGFDGEMEYSWFPMSKAIAYGELHSESRQLGYWEPPASAPQRNAGELQMEIKREQRDGHEVWDVRIDDKQSESVTNYIGVRPDHGYLPLRIEVSSRNQPYSRTEFQDIFEPQPGVWAARTTIVDAFYLDRPAKRAGYTANRTKATITRMELGDAAGLKNLDFDFKVPKDAQVRKWSGNEQRVLPAGVRTVHLQFLGGQTAVPVVGLQVEFTNGNGDLQKTMGTFITDAQGMIEAILPMAFYSLHLKSDQELPYLAVEKLWDGDSRGPFPDLSLYVRPAGAEKWLSGKRRDDEKKDEGGRRKDEQSAKWRVTYTLLPACELVLRAVDAETGKGIAGVEFYEENAVGEEWAHPIYGQNIGSKLIREPEDESQTPAWRTDGEGNFKRLVSANGGYVYGVWKSPAGYEAAEPRGEVEVKIVYGQARAEHVFKFKRIKAAAPAAKPEEVDPNKEKPDPKLGVLTGRFIFDGQRPVPQETSPLLAKLESDSPLPRDSAGRASGVAMTYLDYLKNMIRPSTVNQSLLVDEQGGVANIVVWVESKNIPWQPPRDDGRPPVTIRVQRGNFSPRVTLLTAGQALAVANQDPVMFNFHADFKRNSGINVIVQPRSVNQGKMWKLTEEEKQPEYYRCDLAPWADGWILVRNNPYMAVTDEHGTFAIPNLPPGEWEFRAWHERRGFLTHWPKGLFKQKIVAGNNDLGEVQVKPEVLGVKPEEIAAAEQAARGEANPANPWERKVSLTDKGLTLRAALDKVATQARLKLDLDSAALAEVQLDVEKPTSASFENLPLEIALGRLIDWQAHLGVYRQLRGEKLVITTIAASQKRIASRLPEWLKSHYGQGLLADVNDNGEVVSITASRIVTDELLKKFATLPELRELSIEVTEHLTPAGLAALARMSKLEKLSLYEVNSGDNGLGDDALRHLVGLESLRELSIGECGTTNVGAKFLEQMPQLTSLTLRQEGGLTDAALKSIGKLARLESLSLPSYVATQSYGRMQFSADAIRELKGLKDLESLQLVGHEVPADLLNFPKLTSLSLGSAQVDDEVAQQIARLRELRTLELSFCGIGDNGLEHLATLPKLERLDFSSTAVTDEGIAHFRTNKSLKYISLRSSGLTDESLKHLAQIKTLTRLDLSSGGPPTFGPTKGYTIAGLQELQALPRLDTLWLSGFELPGCVGLKELKHLRSLTFMMCSVTQAELDALEEALPDTNISHATGGGSWMPKRMRAKLGVGSPR